MKTSFLLSALFLFLLSCSPKPDFDIKEIPLKGLVDTVSVVCTGNISGNSLDELIVGKDSLVYIYNCEADTAKTLASIILTDQVILMQTGDVDEDGKNELLVATGQKRYKETDVRLFLIEEEGDEWHTTNIYSKHSLRPHSTDLIIASYPDPEHVSAILSYFESKYMVETVALNFADNEWTIDTLGIERMAMTRDVGIWNWDLLGEQKMEMATGRVYGDEIGMTGDAYFFGPPKTYIHSKRGVKAIRIGDGDNDGENEIYMGDGWHQDYGKIARGRLAEVEIRNTDMNYQLIEDVKYQYEITQIEIEDINHDKLNEVIAKGNKFIRIYQKKDNFWTVYSDSVLPAKQFTIGNISGSKHPEIIFSGPTIQVFNLGNIEFSSELGEEVKTESVSPDSLVGNPAPELSIQQWLNGSFPGLYNSKGQVILLDFWATWCKPCIKTFPEMERLQKTYGPKGLQILGLTRMDNRQDFTDIKEFVEDQDFAYPIGVGDESLNNLVYGVGAIPHVVLIDKKGIVRWWKIGAGDTSEMEDMIIKLLMTDEG